MRLHAQAPLSTMTDAWLLPIVPTIVAAASGGIVAEVLPSRRHALWAVVISYILWGTGVPLAMATLVIYLFRAVDLVQIATSSSYRILFPSTRPTRSRCLRHYAIGQGEYAAAIENRDTRSLSRADSICCRIFRRFDHVGIWTCMVLLRHRVH